MSKRTASFSLLASAKREWLKALRSGEYKQTDSELYSPGAGGYCCLGVLCKINGYSNSQLANQGFPQDVGFGIELLPKKAQKAIADGRKYDVDDDAMPKTWSVRYKGKMVPLSVLNDEQTLSFKEIADIIEKQVPTHK